MSLAALKRKSNAKYGNHTQKNGFSLNGTSRYPSYIGKGSRTTPSISLQGNTCCAYETNAPNGFKSVKNYNSINKHGRLTKWYKEDYTQEEWTQALAQAGLSINDYPYPKPGVIQKIKNNWVQKSEHADGSSHVYTHNKKNEILKQEFQCGQNVNGNERDQCNTSGILTETGIIRHKCVPITKNLNIGNDSTGSLERAKYRRGGLNPTGYARPFPYNTTTPGYRVCKQTENQAIDALKNGYFKNNNINCK